MGEGSLSQEEIDALLQGADDSPFDSGGGSMPSGGSAGDGMSPVDRDIIADIIGSAFGMAGNTLGTILSKNVRITNATSESRSLAEIRTEVGTSSVCIFSNLSGALSGRVSFVMSMENASKIINVMMGGMSTGEMDMAQVQTLKDSLSPIIGTVTAQIGLKLGGGLNGSPAEVVSVKTANDLMLPEGTSFVKTTLNLGIEGISSFKVYYILSLATANDILTLSKRSSQSKGGGDLGGGMNVQVGAQGQMGSGINQIGIKSVAFPSLSTAGTPSGQTNLNLLMDVQMSLTVELGRTKMYIKDILGLGEGSIIELDKLAGEPVDLLVNGKLIAKGEVVVIDENFGVRVTDIVSPTDRIKAEGK
ncbi:MAG: flagellar motor switch protein FliN [Leptospira sp.]|nr:flagellar motor switch protein FliN [Leptospira sp.]